ncbi:hypothetical protein M885DRAFT_502794 [Pelagophyceae sp. CCMP2097]|nr:hypothetical protein M885DRAFT_502794 [Pelagophyceae sp. CCMP2097]
MHGYFGARSAAQGEDSRLKAERQMHDIRIEKARAKAMLPLEVAERQAAVDERAFALAERKAHMDQMKLMMNMLEDATWAASAAMSIFSSPVVSAASSSGAIPKNTCGL